jgi:hypothetical protein
MAKLRTKIAAIIRELKRLQGIPEPWRVKDDEFGFPRMIGVGNGAFIFVSRTIDDGIEAVADQLMTDPRLRLKFSRAEWRAAVRAAFGPTLAAVDLDEDTGKTATEVLKGIRKELYERVEGYGRQEFAFGCTLFSNTALKSFGFGPVVFETRLDWLDRKFREGALRPTTRRRIEQAWSGKRLRKRKPSIDSTHESRILDALDNCAFVCSVVTDGLAAEAGRDKALIAARLATTAIALTWYTPSKALNGMNLRFDRVPFTQFTLSFDSNDDLLVGMRRSHHPIGPTLKTGQWEKILSEWAEYFAIVGDVLDFVVSATSAVRRPQMMQTLVHAFLWFHEGCRELIPVVAVVKFSAALDALAGGRGSGSIRRLVKARPGISDDKPIRPGGPTLKQAIDEIYGEGRSHTIHGTNRRLGYDWTGTRNLAEQFARLCIIASIYWVYQNPSSDEPTHLLG